MQKNIEENNYQDNPDETNIIYPSSSPTQGYQPRLNLEQAIEEGFTIRQQPTKGKAIGFTQQFGNFMYVQVCVDIRLYRIYYRITLYLPYVANLLLL